MLKLYTSYLIVGALVFSLLIVVLASNAAEDADFDWLHLSLISALIIFTTASVIALYKPRIASILGLTTLVGMVPFFWNVLKGTGETIYTALCVISLMAYIIALVISIVVILKKESGNASKGNNFLRISLTIFPWLPIVWYALYILCR